jgi:hypothetical protein
MKDDDDMVMGAKPIACEYWGDEKYFRRVYSNVAQLPLFHHGRTVCAFKSALRAHKAAIVAQKKAVAARMVKAVSKTALLSTKSVRVRKSTLREVIAEREASGRSAA